jgi:hypothetical protein
MVSWPRGHSPNYHAHFLFKTDLSGDLSGKNEGRADPCSHHTISTQALCPKHPAYHCLLAPETELSHPRMSVYAPNTALGHLTKDVLFATSPSEPRHGESRALIPYIWNTTNLLKGPQQLLVCTPTWSLVTLGIPKCWTVSSWLRTAGFSMQELKALASPRPSTDIWPTDWSLLSFSRPMEKNCTQGWREQRWPVGLGF